MSVAIATERKFLTPKDLAERWNIRPQTLALWRCARTVDLPYTRIGTRINYRIDDVERFESENRVGGDPAND